ncbi:hypothetical protein [Nocardia sp. bgisy134]|uniref:hypothetical protein n=1 Tax=Nocardia sp. bgisy134 TaxID=3413789 RepID=UPI003D749E69
MSFNDQPVPENDLIDKGVDHRTQYYQEDVSFLSNVGLAGDEELGGIGVTKGTLAGDAWDIYGNIRAGNIGESVFGAAGVGASIAEAITDPFAFVGGQIARWMFEHIEPMRQALESLAGNPTMVEAYSTSWFEISKELTGIGEAWKTGLTTDISTWTGSAGDAYRNRANELIDKISTAAGLAAGLSMDLVSKWVDIARTLVRDILSSMIGAAIGYTIELAVTAGAAAGHVIASALRRFARDSLEISVYLKDLAKSFMDLKTYREPAAKFMAHLMGMDEEPEAQPA